MYEEKIKQLETELEDKNLQLTIKSMSLQEENKKLHHKINKQKVRCNHVGLAILYLCMKANLNRQLLAELFIEKSFQLKNCKNLLNFGKKVELWNKS